MEEAAGVFCTGNEGSPLSRAFLVRLAGFEP